MDYSTETDELLFADLCEVDRAAAEIAKRCENDGKTVQDALMGLMDELHEVCGVQLFSAGDAKTGHCWIACGAGRISIWVPVSDDWVLTTNRMVAVAVECLTHAIETRSLRRFKQNTSVFALDECRCAQCEGVIAA